MKGIDSDADTFDPTSGTSPALIRNNIDQVWVPQVCASLMDITLILISIHYLHWLARF
jgi:hypothetical protein